VAVRRVGGKPQAMWFIVKASRRPPTGRHRDRNGGFPRLSDSVAHASRCPALPRRTLLAENLGKPSLWVIIVETWYERRKKLRKSEFGLIAEPAPANTVLFGPAPICCFLMPPKWPAPAGSRLHRGHVESALPALRRPALRRANRAGALLRLPPPLTGQ